MDISEKHDDQGIPVLKPIIVLNDKSSSHLFISLHECADRHAMKTNIAQPLILYEYFFRFHFYFVRNKMILVTGFVKL